MRRKLFAKKPHETKQQNNKKTWERSPKTLHLGEEQSKTFPGLSFSLRLDDFDFL